MITPRYEEYLSSDDWKDLKKKVIVRSKGKCEGCGDQTYLDVHHLTYERIGMELLTDLTAYCRDCHEKAHGKKEKTAWNLYIKAESSTKPLNDCEITTLKKNQEAARSMFGNAAKFETNIEEIEKKDTGFQQKLYEALNDDELTFKQKMKKKEELKKEYWNWSQSITENGRGHLTERIHISLGYSLGVDINRESVGAGL